MNDFNRVLVLAPHTDDGEIGCGGTIAKLIKEGKDVYCVAFSSAAISVPEGMPKDILIKEIKEATAEIGLPAKNLILLDYETRTFPEHRQEILDDMLKLNKEIKPNLVFLPSTFDTHQDHQIISQEGFRAFKKTSLLGYEEAWNNLTFSTEGFSILSEEDLQKKIKAILCYKSQSARYIMSADFFTSLAKIRGAQINAKYAEAFEVIRSIF